MSGDFVDMRESSHLLATSVDGVGFANPAVHVQGGPKKWVFSLYKHNLT